MVAQEENANLNTGAAEQALGESPGDDTQATPASDDGQAEVSGDTDSGFSEDEPAASRPVVSSEPAEQLTEPEDDNDLTVEAAAGLTLPIPTAAPPMQPAAAQIELGSLAPQSGAPSPGNTLLEMANAKDQATIVAASTPNDSGARLRHKAASTPGPTVTPAAIETRSEGAQTAQTRPLEPQAAGTSGWEIQGLTPARQGERELRDLAALQGRSAHTQASGVDALPAGAAQTAEAARPLEAAAGAANRPDLPVIRSGAQLLPTLPNDATLFNDATLPNDSEVNLTQRGQSPTSHQTSERLSLASKLSTQAALDADETVDDDDAQLVDEHGSWIDSSSSEEVHPYPSVNMSRFARAYPGAMLRTPSWGHTLDAQTRAALELTASEALAEDFDESSPKDLGDPDLSLYAAPEPLSWDVVLPTSRNAGSARDNQARPTGKAQGTTTSTAQAPARLLSTALDPVSVRDRNDEGSSERHQRQQDKAAELSALPNFEPELPAKGEVRAEAIQRPAPVRWVEQVRAAVNQKLSAGQELVRTAVIDVPDERAGRIRMELEIAGGKLTIHLSDATPEVKAMFESSFSDLQQQLSRQNINLASFTSGDKGERGRGEGEQAGSSRGSRVAGASTPGAGAARATRPTHDGLIDTVI